MRWVIGLAIVAGGVTLAVVIGQRMSTDAMAVVIGVVFGVAASIPTSLLVVAATRGRRDESRYSSAAARSMGPDPRPPAAAPQIYVVSPPMQHPSQAPAPWHFTGGMMPQLPPPPGDYFPADSSRRFKVVGEDEHWLDASD